MMAFMKSLYVVMIIAFGVCADDIYEMPSLITNWNLNVKSHSKFTVKIRGNPTTGYIWIIDNAEKVNIMNESSNLITCINLNNNNSTNDYLRDNQNENIVGQSGFYLFNFITNIVTVPTSFEIDFIEKKPWEKNPFRIVKVIITVNP